MIIGGKQRSGGANSAVNDEVVLVTFHGKGEEHKVEHDTRSPRVVKMNDEDQWWRRNWPTKGGSRRGERRERTRHTMDET